MFTEDLIKKVIQDNKIKESNTTYIVEFDSLGSINVLEENKDLHYTEDCPIPLETTNNLFGFNIDDKLVDEFHSWCDNKGLAANEEIFEIWVQCSDMDADEEEKYLFDKGLL